MSMLAGVAGEWAVKHKRWVLAMVPLLVLLLLAPFALLAGVSALTARRIALSAGNCVDSAAVSSTGDANVDPGGGYVPDSTPRADLFTVPNESVIQTAWRAVQTYTRNGQSPSERVVKSWAEMGYVESNWHVWSSSRIKGSDRFPHDKFAVGHDHYSGGYAQQQSGPNGEDGFGWGTVRETMDVGHATRAYLAAAMDKDGGVDGDAATLAQAVQVSGTSDGSTYRRRGDDADKLIARLRGQGGNAPAALDAALSLGGVPNDCCVAANVAEAPVAATAGGWAEPVKGVHGTPFWKAGSAWSWKGHHTGVDFTGSKGGAAFEGTPIHAAGPGKVEAVEHGGAYGNHVTIDHGKIDGDHIETLYAHMSRVAKLEVGQVVNTSTVIGYVGHTGNVFPRGPGGSHLHFEVHRNYSNGADNSTFLDGFKFIADHKGSGSAVASVSVPAPSPSAGAGGGAAATGGATTRGPTITVTIGTWNSYYAANPRSTIEGARALAAVSDAVGFQEFSPQSTRNLVHAALQEHYAFTKFENQTQIGYNKDKYRIAKDAQGRERQGQVRAFPDSKVEPTRGGKRIYNEKFIQWVVLVDKRTGATFALVNTHVPNAIESKGQPNKKHPLRVALAFTQFNKTAAILSELAKEMPTFETMDSNEDFKAAHKNPSPKFSERIFGRVGFISDYAALGLPKVASHGKRYIDYVYFSRNSVAPLSQRSFDQQDSDHGGRALTATINMTRSSCSSAQAVAEPGAVSLTDPGPGDKDCGPSGIAHCLRPRALNVYKTGKATWDCKVNPEPGCLRSYGGWRGDGDHSEGLAVDFMVTDGSAVNKGQAAHGWVEANWFRTHAKDLGIQYVIFDEKIWNISRDAEGWRHYDSITGSDNPSSLHQNHIHITVQQPGLTS